MVNGGKRSILLGQVNLNRADFSDTVDLQELEPRHSSYRESRVCDTRVRHSRLPNQLV